MSWIYAFGEAIQSLKRAKLSSLLSILTVAFSLFLSGIFLVFILEGWNLIGQLKSRLEMEVFLMDRVAPETISQLKTRLMEREEIDEVHFVSKEQALEEFSREFSEDVASLIGENPLPSSFRIKLKGDYHDEKSIGQLRDRITDLGGVEEVVYRFDLLQFIERYLQIAIVITLLVGGLSLFASIMLIANTVRLSILTRRDSIEIMSLVGATHRFIRQPFLIEGGIQGFIGAIFAILTISLLAQILQFFDYQPNTDLRLLSIILLISGVLLGDFGSWLAIKKSLRQVIS